MKNFFCELDIINVNRTLDAFYLSQVCRHITESGRVSYFAAIQHFGEERGQPHYHFLLRSAASNVDYATLKGSCYFGDNDLNIKAVQSTFEACRAYMLGEGKHEGKVGVVRDSFFEFGELPVGRGRKAGVVLIEDVYVQVLDLVQQGNSPWEIVHACPRVLPHLRQVMLLCEMRHGRGGMRREKPEKVF